MIEQMTDQEALEMYEEMKKVYGNALPHPDHQEVMKLMVKIIISSPLISSET